MMYRSKKDYELKKKIEKDSHTVIIFYLFFLKKKQTKQNNF